MVVSLSFFPREEWKVTKGRSGRPDEKGPVGGASCRSVCNSRGRTTARKKTELHLCRDSTNCKTRQDAPPAAALEDPHRPFFERPDVIPMHGRGAGERKAAQIRKRPARTARRRTPGACDARTGIPVLFLCRRLWRLPCVYVSQTQERSHIRQETFSVICGSAPAYFIVSAASDSAHNESIQIEMRLPPHCLQINR